LCSLMDIADPCELKTLRKVAFLRSTAHYVVQTSAMYAVLSLRETNVL